MVGNIVEIKFLFDFRNESRIEKIAIDDSIAIESMLPESLAGKPREATNKAGTTHLHLPTPRILCGQALPQFVGHQIHTRPSLLAKVRENRKRFFMIQQQNKYKRKGGRKILDCNLNAKYIRPERRRHREGDAPGGRRSGRATLLRSHAGIASHYPFSFYQRWPGVRTCLSAGASISRFRSISQVQ